MFCARKNVSSYYGEGEKDIWKAYVRRGMNSEKGQMKLRLLDWGCTVERLQLKRIILKSNRGYIVMILS